MTLLNSTGSACDNVTDCVRYETRTSQQNYIKQNKQIVLALVTKLPVTLHAQVLFSINSRNDLSPFGTKPFSDSMLTFPGFLFELQFYMTTQPALFIDISMKLLI